MSLSFAALRCYDFFFFQAILITCCSGGRGGRGVSYYYSRDRSRRSYLLLVPLGGGIFRINHRLYTEGEIFYVFRDVGWRFHVVSSSSSFLIEIDVVGRSAKKGGRRSARRWWW
jgi:hypothetical protein